MIDYEAIKLAVIGRIKAHTGKQVVLQAGNAPQPPYPFCSYTLTSPYLPVSHAEVGLDIVEDVELVFSLTWHSQSATEAQGLAHQTAMLFKSRNIRQQLGDEGIVVVRLESFQNRDTFLTIDSERRVGLDIRFRIRHIETQPEFENIESITVPEI